MLSDKKGSVKIACVGDSVTYGSTLKNRLKECYPEILQELLGRKYRVMNFGYPGATVSPKGDFPYLNNDNYLKSQAFKPDLLVFEMGSNDSKTHNWKDAKTFKSDYLSLLYSYRLENPNLQVILVLPLSVYHELWNIQKRVIDNDIFNTIIAISKEQNLFLLNPRPSFDNHLELYSDMIHPNKDGAYALAKLLVPIITNI